MTSHGLRWYWLRRYVIGRSAFSATVCVCTCVSEYVAAIIKHTQRERHASGARDFGLVQHHHATVTECVRSSVCCMWSRTRASKHKPSHFVPSRSFTCNGDVRLSLAAKHEPPLRMPNDDLLWRRLFCFVNQIIWQKLRISIDKEKKRKWVVVAVAIVVVAINTLTNAAREREIHGRKHDWNLWFELSWNGIHYITTLKLII